jgi:hypothetical protein
MSEMKEIKAGRVRWPKGVGAEDTTEDIDDYIKFKITEYTHYGTQDEELWEVFQEDFKGFSLAALKECSQLGIRQLRTLLRTNGVWVRKDRRKTVAESLYNTLQEEEPTEWTAQEIEEHLQAVGDFKSARINYMLRQNEAASSVHAQTTVPPDPDPDPPDPLDPSDFPDPYQHRGQRTESVNKEPVSREQSYGRELANLAKMYTDESKYSGENDNFNYKLVIFNDICGRVDIPDTIKAKAYPMMLRGLALDHYYSSIKGAISTYNLSFNQVCESTRNYFEGPEYKRGVLGRWNSTILKAIMQKNSGKSTEDCLQLLIKELRHLQHGLDTDLRTDKFLHNKIINACQDLPACQYTCFRPSDSLAGLMNDLRSSITTWEKSNPGETSQFFTDRRYHSNPFHHSQRPSRSFRNKDSRFGSKDQKKKRCFVCDKEGCWSSNHSKEEREV